MEQPTKDGGIYYHPTLFKRNSSGKAMQWSVRTEGEVMITSSGMVDGKIKDQRRVCKAKNIGKANETSPQDQARKEAKAKWLYQIQRKDYNEDIEKAGLQARAMLALDYKKVGHRVNWDDAVGQPKLNGLRLTAGNDTIENGYDPEDFNMLSREGEHYNVIHLEPDSSQFLDTVNNYVMGTGYHCLSLDGELYLHGLPLQEIGSRADRYQEGLTEELEYHLFDLMIPGMPFIQRYSILLNLLNSYNLQNSESQLKLVEIIYTEDEEAMKRHHMELCEQGYEGIMIRHKDGEYKIAGRSPDLFKYKIFYDDEYKIIDVWEDSNGNAMFTCEIQEGFQFSFKDHIATEYSTFNCTPKRTHKMRKEILQNKEDYIGKWINVKYQDLSEDGIPQFNVGLELRKCDDSGNPIF